MVHKSYVKIKIFQNGWKYLRLLINPSRPCIVLLFWVLNCVFGTKAGDRMKMNAGLFESLFLPKNTYVVVVVQPKPWTVKKIN